VDDHPRRVGQREPSKKRVPRSRSAQPRRPGKRRAVPHSSIRLACGCDAIHPRSPDPSAACVEIQIARSPAQGPRSLWATPILYTASSGERALRGHVLSSPAIALSTRSTAAQRPESWNRAVPPRSRLWRRSKAFFLGPREIAARLCGRGNEGAYDPRVAKAGDRGHRDRGMGAQAHV
jgi:hypothetical protein